MMARSKSMKSAAALQIVLALLDAGFALPILAAGGNGLPAQPGYERVGGPPFWAGVLFLVVGVAGVFGGYGLWTNQKWGKVLSIVTRVLMGLFDLGDLLGAVVLRNYLLVLVAAVYALASILVIVLVLRREYKPATA